MSEFTDELPAIEKNADPVGNPADARDDESAASRARSAFHERGIEPVEADRRIRDRLLPGEAVLAVRRDVAIDRRPSGRDIAPPGVAFGDLYVTSTRLVHLVEIQGLSVDLDDIEDAELVGDRVLLAMRDGGGIIIAADRPRLLRVQLAAARAGRSGK